MDIRLLSLKQYFYWGWFTSRKILTFSPTGLFTPSWRVFVKIHTKCFKRHKWFKEFQIYFKNFKPSCRIYIFAKINYQGIEKHDETASKNYFRKIVNACPLFTVRSSLDNSAYFVGYFVPLNSISISGILTGQ